MLVQDVVVDTKADGATVPGSVTVVVAPSVVANGIVEQVEVMGAGEGFAVLDGVVAGGGLNVGLWGLVQESGVEVVGCWAHRGRPRGEPVKRRQEETRGNTRKGQTQVVYMEAAFFVEGRLYTNRNP